MKRKSRNRKEKKRQRRREKKLKEKHTNCRQGFCMCCNEFVIGLEKHHLFPKCHFGKYGKLIDLCTKCHKEYEIEYMQPMEGLDEKRRRYKRPRSWYRDNFEQFLEYFKNKKK